MVALGIILELMTWWLAVDPSAGHCESPLVIKYETRDCRGSSDLSISRDIVGFMFDFLVLLA